MTILPDKRTHHSSVELINNLSNLYPRALSHCVYLHVYGYVYVSDGLALKLLALDLMETIK